VFGLCLAQGLELMLWLGKVLVLRFGFDLGLLLGLVLEPCLGLG
jgi:hypothetical protein